MWNLEHCVSKSPVSAGSGNPLYENGTRRLTGQSPISPIDLGDSTGLSNAYLRVPVGGKRKVPQASLGTETVESERSKSRIFRQVPVFSSQRGPVDQEEQESSRGQQTKRNS